MTTSTVIDSNEISLNAVRFPIIGTVQRQLVSIYAEKQIIGDVSRDTHPNESVLSLTNWPGGIGLEKMEGAQGVKRTWWSTCDIRHKVLTLPPLVTQTADQGVSGTYDILLAEYLVTDTEIYAAFGAAIYKYDSNDSWGSALDTMPGAATDVITTRVGTTYYLVFAHTTGYTYTSDGAAFVDRTIGTKYLAYHDGALWGIDANGTLWTSTSLGTETGKAQVPTANATVTSLFVSRAPDGNMSLYTMTQAGLFIYDQTNNRWVITQMQLVLHPRAGRGTTNWRDSLFIPSGLSIYEYRTIDSASVAVRLVGPDMDDGLPRAQRGEIRKLAGSNNELLALVVGGDIDVAFTNVSYGHGVKGSGGTGSAAPAFETSTTSTGPQKGGSAILGWDGATWQTKWEGGTTVAGAAPSDLIVSQAYDQYRAWWTFDQRVYFMPLTTSITNPSEIRNFAYAASSTHEWPFFDADDEDSTKLALRFVGTAEGMSEDETIDLKYILDYGTTETTVGEINSDGRFAFDLPASGVGVVFRSIRPIVELARGGTNRFNTPKLRSLDLVYRKKLSPKWGFEVRIDTRSEYRGLSAMELRQAIITAAGSGPLIVFNYRDESQGESSINVDILRVAGIERTGLDHGDEVILTLVEV